MSDRATTRSRAARSRNVTRLALLVTVLLLVAAILATRSILRARRGVEPAARQESAFAGERVRVQVLNATKTRGLARRATLYLRDRGFDVVDMGTAGQELDSTLVLDRSGHPEWASRVAEALGGARVEARPDTSRYLDVTVLIGRSWRPPAEPFYP